MQQSFYNDLRKNNHSAKSNRSRVIQSARSSSNKPILINYEKRNKLKSLLIQKFTKKYNLKVNEPAIDEEVTKFLFKETLTDNDLKQLDKKISDILGKKNLLKNIENSTKNEEMYSEYDMEMNEIKGKQRLNTALERKSGDEMSVRSGLSGASKLSKVKNHKKDLTEEELECLSIYSNYKPKVLVKINTSASLRLHLTVQILILQLRNGPYVQYQQNLCHILTLYWIAAQTP